jgi:multiple sugar transport system permease protein
MAADPMTDDDPSRPAVTSSLAAVRGELNLYNALRLLGAVVWITVWIVPIVAMAYIALKPTNQLLTGAFWALPTDVALLSNLRTAWVDANFNEYAVNSFIYASVGASGAVLLASFAAFAIVQLDPPGENVLLYGILLFTFFPFQMYLIPLVKMYQATGIYSTKTGMVLIYTTIAIPFAAFLMRNYLATIPHSLYESARIDGLTNFQIYWKIYLPLAKPAFAVGLIFQWIWIWNEFLFGLVLTSDTGARPIATGLSGLSGRSPRWSVLAAGTLLTVIAPVAIYVFFQKYFERGLLAGAQKG